MREKHRAIGVVAGLLAGLVLAGLVLWASSAMADSAGLPGGPTGPGGFDPAWLKAFQYLTWPGAVAAVGLGFLYSRLGQAVGEKVRVSAPAAAASMLPAMVADLFREIAQTLREVTGTQQTMAKGLGDLAELVRDMQGEQRESNMQQRQLTQQQQQMLSQQQNMQEKLAELVGRVAGIQGR